jgi:hypothetical protein
MQISNIQVSSGSTPALAETRSASSHDPRDTNQDGVVSFAEQLAYSLGNLQDKAATSGSALGSYGQDGVTDQTGSAAKNTVDTYV